MNEEYPTIVQAVEGLHRIINEANSAILEEMYQPRLWRRRTLGDKLRDIRKAFRSYEQTGIDKQGLVDGYRIKNILKLAERYMITRIEL